MSSKTSGLDIVVFAPHPDDAEICCGGLLLKMRELGHSTAVVDLTRGELGTRGTVETRAQETAAANKILQLSHRENLGFPDAKINDGSRADDSQLMQLTLAIRRLKPEIVVFPYWADRHPDHGATSKLCTRAVFFAGMKNYPVTEDLPAHTPRQVLYYQLRTQMPVSFLVDISSVQAKKMEAIRCYATQVGITGPQSNTLLSSPGTLPSIESRDAYNGSQIGVAFAEPYLMKSHLHVADPVRHFREVQTQPAQFFLE